MNISKKMFNFIKNPHIPWFIINRVTKISPLLAKILKHGRLNINTKKYWDGIYASRTYQSTEVDRHLELMKQIMEFIKAESEVLDVGCGSGFLMQMLRDRKGCHCIGIDISEVSIDIVRRMGFDGYMNKLPDLPPEVSDKRFDIITVVEILEHLRHPDKTLRSLASVLAPDGRLIASVPNDCMKPGEIDEHLHSFTSNTFQALIGGFYEVESCISVQSGVHEYLVACAKSRM